MAVFPQEATRLELTLPSRIASMQDVVGVVEVAG